MKSFKKLLEGKEINQTITYDDLPKSVKEQVDKLKRYGSKPLKFLRSDMGDYYIYDVDFDGLNVTKKQIMAIDFMDLDVDYASKGLNFKFDVDK